MPYTLKHTAEELDRKLSLIDENKNLLPYPYKTALPVGLEDVGDGSILTTDVSSPEERVLLNTRVLPAGKYTVSLETTNIIDEITTAVANPGFSLEITAAGAVIANADSSASIELSAETAVEVYLNVPAVFDTNLVIKPQIEPGEEKTGWVPYMGTVSSYVDERFNSTNAKIKAAVKALDDTKVNKVAGKDLSTNDYTNIEKIKLAGIEDGAEKNVQGDWNQNDETAPDYVKNRTHYEENIHSTELIEEAYIYNSTYSDDTYTTFSMDTLQGNYIVGQTYMLEFISGSGSVLKTAYSDCYSSMAGYCFGNKSILFGPGYEDGNDDSYCLLIENGELYWADFNSYPVAVRVYEEGSTYSLKQLDEKFIPDSIVRKDELQNYAEYQYVDTAISSIDTSKNWNQNDESAADYIKNRTHYSTETTAEEVLCQEYIDDKYPDSSNFVTTLPNIDTNNSIGETWKVTLVALSGTEYSYTGIIQSSSFGSHIGNTAVVTGYSGSGDPYCIIGNELYCVDAYGKITVSKEVLVEEVKQLDEKYIPDTIARYGENISIEGEGASAFGIESIARGDATHAEGYQSLAGSYSFKFNLDHEYTEADYDTTDGTGWYYLTDVSGLKDLINSKEIKTTVNPETFDLKCFNDIFPIPYGAGYYLLTISLNEYQQNVLNKTKYTWEHQCSECGKVYRFEFTLPEYDWPSGAEEIGIFPTWWNDNDDFVHFRIGVECYAVEDFGPDVIPEIYTIDNVIEYPEYTLVLKNNYDFWGRLLAVDEENKAIQVSNYKIPVEGTGTEVKETSYFIIPTHPELGTEFVIGAGAHAEGYQTVAFALGAHAEGYASIASGKYSHAEGRQTKAGYAAHAEGRETLAKGENTHAEGVWTKALGGYSHAEGFKSVSSGSKSHAEGIETDSAGVGSHSEGTSTLSSGNSSHAEGQGTVASGEAAHTEGQNTTASGAKSHAEGSTTIASGASSHAEGMNTKAVGEASHAEGGYSEANAKRSHAEGTTVAGSEFQHTEGKYNIIDTEGKYAHIVGNGSSSTNRSNAHTIDWDGNAWFAGDVLSKDGKLATMGSIGYERHVYFMPNDNNETALFRFDTKNKTLTIRPVRFLIPELVNISSEIVLSYADMGYNPLFLIFDYAYDTKNIASCLRISRRDELKTLTTNYAVIMSFNASSLTNPQNISFKGTYSVNEKLYNESYSRASVESYVESTINEHLSNYPTYGEVITEGDLNEHLAEYPSNYEVREMLTNYIEKDGDVSSTTLTFSNYDFPVKADINIPGLYETGTNNLIKSWDELNSEGHIRITNINGIERATPQDIDSSYFNGDLVLPRNVVLGSLGNLYNTTALVVYNWEDPYGMELYSLKYLYYPECNSFDDNEWIITPAFDGNYPYFIYKDKATTVDGKDITFTNSENKLLLNVINNIQSDIETLKNTEVPTVTEDFVGYERDIHFVPYGKDQDVLFQFNTSAKTLTVKAIRFMLPKMVDITSDTVLSYDGITTNPNFLVFDLETTDRTQYLKIVKRDELKSLKTRYSVILTFNLQNLANTANVSYKGAYSVNGTVYNQIPLNQNFTTDVLVPASGWSGSSSSGYSQNVSVANIKSSDTPIIDVVLGNNRNTNETLLTAWEKITRITTSNGTITVYADWVKPDTDVTLQLKVVR